MDANSNDVEVTITTVRSSFSLPSWMDRQIEDIAERTFSSKSQVVRRLLAGALERESAELTAEASR